jgi:hypothetical protein
MAAEAEAASEPVVLRVLVVRAVVARAVLEPLVATERPTLVVGVGVLPFSAVAPLVLLVAMAAQAGS